MLRHLLNCDQEMPPMSDINAALRLAASRHYPIVLCFFVGSGAAALVYEIVWFQLLELVIGSSAVSLAVLLGTFMGGMCLGSIAFARVVPASWHPLRVYAVMELGIGVIAIPGAVLPALRRGLVRERRGAGFTGLFFRALLSIVFLLPPTVLMGATLPCAARWVESTPHGVSWLGILYTANLGGAVFGCLLAGFYLLRLYDMATATFVAAAINALCAVLALVFAMVASHATSPARALGGPAPLRLGSVAVYVTIALSGLTALGAQVVWTRLLSLLLGTSVYTFSIILAVFLLGLGLGSSVGAFSRAQTGPANRARLVAGASCSCHRLGGDQHRRLVAVLADQSAAHHRSVDHVPARSGARVVGRAAGRLPVGRELSARARCRGAAPRGYRTRGRGGLCGKHHRRDRRRIDVQPDPDPEGRHAMVATHSDGSSGARGHRDAGRRPARRDHRGPQNAAARPRGLRSPQSRW
jgi:hypothetical protein